MRHEYPAIIQVFKSASFPPEIITGLLLALDDLPETPLIVRSSSLIEDSKGTSFAGKYKSLFIANQGTKHQRLLALMDAVAEVYAPEAESRMGSCFIVADLHGRLDRYQKLFAAVEEERPAAPFLGGDLFPSGLAALAGIPGHEDFLRDFIAPGFAELKRRMGSDYPAVFVILGNDDARIDERELETAERQLLWNYAHTKCLPWRDHRVYGYAYIPPTPFMLKDWERYDVSKYLDPLCMAPEEGWLSVPVERSVLRYQTIQKDLRVLVKDEDLSRSIFLFHTPPYGTGLERAALDGKRVNYVDLDVHVGSIAVRRFIESRQPRLTLHGHIHESAESPESGGSASAKPFRSPPPTTDLSRRWCGSIWITWKKQHGNCYDAKVQGFPCRWWGCWLYASQTGNRLALWHYDFPVEAFEHNGGRAHGRTKHSHHRLRHGKT